MATRLMLIRTRTILLSVVLPSVLHGQALDIKNGRGGIISVGGRSSLSFFNEGDTRNTGNGIGGQFRVQLSDRVNTDWFYDYLTSPIGDFAHRQDQHIGWSVLFYLREPRGTRQIVQPYVLAGHCFDYSKLIANGAPMDYTERWSSAVQAGLGTHFNLTDRMDISLVGQYMAHLGNHVHAEQHEDEVEFHEEPGAGLEGHLLVHLSFNYKLWDSW